MKTVSPEYVIVVDFNGTFNEFVRDANGNLTSEYPDAWTTHSRREANFIASVAKGKHEEATVWIYKDYGMFTATRVEVL